MTILILSSLQASLVKLLLPENGFTYGEMAAAGNQYYFSSFRGNDNNAGTSSTAPWKSIEKLNNLIPGLLPGDVIYFERGSEWDNAGVNIQNVSGTASNPILFTAYGNGPLPRFKGSKVVTSFDQSGTLWYKNESGLPVYDQSSAIRAIPFVYINGKGYDCSRYPNTGYLKTHTTGTKNFLDDNTQNWGTDFWKNGLVAVRNVNWRWATRKINSNTSTSLYFDDMDCNYEMDNTPYLIRNHLNACDLNGEWAQQNESLWIYWNGNLNSQKVEVPFVKTIFKINNSSYLVFENLQIERAVVYGMHISGSNIDISNCTISDAGGMLVYAENHSIISTTGSSFTGGKRGGVFYDFSEGTVSNNSFKKMYFDGVDNTEFTYGACIACWHSEGKFYSEYNRMDSINLGYNMHWSKDSVWIGRNYITNFGFTVRDAAAIYFGTDFTGPSQGSTKFVKNNIMLNAINDYVHGIYIDCNSNYVKCDSNTTANTNISVFIHDSHHIQIKNTNIINPAKDMKAYAWNEAIRLDEYAYQYVGGKPVENCDITDNVVVMGETPNESAVMLFSISNLASNNIDRNTYIDPFKTDDVIFGVGQDYSTYNFYNMSQWLSKTGIDGSSDYNSINYPYSDNLGIPKDKFVKLLFNPTNQVVRYDMKTLDAYYVDINGLPTEDYVTIQPYYSVILFYKSERTPLVVEPPITDTVDVVENPPVVDTANNAPALNDHFFIISEEHGAGDAIGALTGNDLDSEQQLTYSIISGNEAGYFSIDQHSAEVFLLKTPDYSNSNKYQLVVRVTDNGVPALYTDATVMVSQIAKSGTVYIDPTNVNDPEEEGSVDHPFDSWYDVKWNTGTSYLQKRNTSASVERITVSADAVTLGAYGEGEMPEIISDSKDFVFAFYEKSNVVISELNVRNESGISLIYFLGSSTNNIVERCKLEGSNYGVRIVDGSNYVVRYNTFKNNSEAVCSYSENTKIYYNIFRDNESAINISSHLSSAEIFNNVFYDNAQSLKVTYADLVLYNNIFYLANAGDKAIVGNFESLMSDNNLFYPEQSAFMKINGVVYNTLSELQLAFRQDVNSLCADPLFNDVFNDDFGLEESSPAINAGKLLSGLSTDFSGLSVPVGNKPDIGVNESDSEIILQPVRDKLLVYPNPSNGEFEIELEADQVVNAVLDILDINGRKIFTNVISSEEGGELRKRINITNVPSGIYFLHVILGSDVLTTRLVIN